MKHIAYYPLENIHSTHASQGFSKGDQIMKLSPFRSALSLQHEIDRLFNEWPVRNNQSEWHPVVDVQEKENAIMVVAELPGVKSEDVKISLEDNVLSISGTKKKSLEKEDQNYFRAERAYGTFARSFKLPSTIDSDKISANYKDGILTVSLPKAEEAKPKEIPITTS